MPAKKKLWIFKEFHQLPVLGFSQILSSHHAQKIYTNLKKERKASGIFLRIWSEHFVLLAQQPAILVSTFICSLINMEQMLYEELRYSIALNFRISNGFWFDFCSDHLKIVEELCIRVLVFSFFWFPLKIRYHK